MDDPYYLALLADACLRAGRLDAAQAASKAVSRMAPTGRKFFFESELHRLAGELLLRLGRYERGRDASARGAGVGAPPGLALPRAARGAEPRPPPPRPKGRTTRHAR